jgi:lysozyme
MKRNILIEHTERYNNLVAFLWMVRVCQGTDAVNGYRYLYGSTKKHELVFDDFSKHPNIRKAFTQPDGTTGYTTAAGAYMIDDRKWYRILVKLNLPDFSPESQDRAAMCLILEHAQLTNVELGRIQRAMDVMWKEWPALPAANYEHPSKFAPDLAMAAYVQAGGNLS